MSDGAKTALTFVLVGAVFLLFAEFAEGPWRILGAVPLMTLAGASLVFRWPGYIHRYFQGVVERDAERGVMSIRNLGMAVIVAVGAVLFVGMSGTT
jgi:hypothetical protein